MFSYIKKSDVSYIVVNFIPIPRFMSIPFRILSPFHSAFYPHSVPPFRSAFYPHFVPPFRSAFYPHSISPFRHSGSAFYPNHHCPMQGNCLQANVVYKAEITTADNNETKTYIGVTANEFKIRFRNQTKSINETENSKSSEIMMTET